MSASVDDENNGHKSFVDRSFVNCDDPDLQKKVNDNLALALSEAHNRIRELEKDNQILSDDNTRLKNS